MLSEIRVTSPSPTRDIPSRIMLLLNGFMAEAGVSSVHFAQLSDNYTRYRYIHVNMEFPKKIKNIS